MASQDYTTYTEVDPNARITVAAGKIDYAAIDREEEAYVYKDMGADYFNEDFDHKLDLRVTAHAGNGSIALWGMANSVGAIGPISDAFRVQVNYSTTEYRLILAETDDSTVYTEYYVMSESTTYYCRVKRGESVGTYGTIYLDIYSSAANRDNEASALANLSIALHGSKKDFRYLYALSTLANGNNTQTMTGYVENLDILNLKVGTGTVSAAGSLSASSNEIYGSTVATTAGVGSITAFGSRIRPVTGAVSGVGSLVGTGTLTYFYDLIIFDGYINQQLDKVGFIDQQFYEDGYIDQQRNFILEK